MTNLDYITEHFPIRRTEAQKTAFRKWAMGRIADMGYPVCVEENDKGRHKNMIVGDPEAARVVFTAHYDTPASIGIPNLMIPRNFPVYLLYQATVVGGMLAIALAVGILFSAVTQNRQALLWGYFLVYLGLMLLLLYGPANKHNVNDNTSGVATLLDLLENIPAEQRDRAAFIFFDNEEKGCKGSKAYAREHLQVQHTRLIVNLDCVGVGEHILLLTPALARNMPEYEVMERALLAQPGREVRVFSAATSRGNSDFRSFKCGVGVAAYRQVGGVGFYTGDIHTARDTQTDPENLAFLVQALGAGLEKL